MDSKTQSFLHDYENHEWVRNMTAIQMAVAKGEIYWEWTRKGWGDMFDKYHNSPGWLPDSKLNQFIREELKDCF